MGDLDQVRELAERVLADHDRLDVLVHNAGALTAERHDASDGTEATVASQVVGPFLLTGLLFDRLVESAPSRVITMSSGGMYGAGLTVSKLEMPADSYRGAEQYARAKRAQVTLNNMWAERFGDLGVRFHSMHPGWADTPGVDASLPTFARIMGPLLRTPEQGADTLVWLAADDGEPLESNGEFWLDRRPRSIHKLPTTRRTDTPERREQLWDWVADIAGIEPSVTRAKARR
jgi:NAD(P)-dependent dehydrogenase (short-subunit alcohol dehydrogenase family)